MTSPTPRPVSPHLEDPRVCAANSGAAPRLMIPTLLVLIPLPFLYAIVFAGCSNSRNVNFAPVTETGVAVDVIEDSSQDVDLLNFVTDANNDPLTITAVGLPTRGTVKSMGGSLVTYRPDPDYFGTDFFTYVVVDQLGSSAEGTIGLEVAPVNDPPVARPDQAVTFVDVPVDVTVLANDTDIDDTDLTVVADDTSIPQGTIELNPDGTIRYTPPPGFSGSDEFSYRAQDAAGAESTALVTVMVEIALVDDVATTDEDVSVLIDVLANDRGVDPATLGIATPPAHGIATVEGDAIRYSPAADFNGEDAFEYSGVSPGGPDQAQVTITVQPVNDPPIAVDDDAVVLLGATVAIAVLDNDFDVDGDSLRIDSVPVPPTQGTVEIDASDTVISYTPALGFAGADSFEYAVTDDQGGIDSGTVTVEVTPLTFSFQGQDSDTPFDPREDEIVISVPLQVLEKDLSGGPHAIGRVVMTLAHDPAILGAIAVERGDDLTVDAVLKSTVTTEQTLLAITFPTRITAEVPREVARVQFATRALRGNPVPVTTELSWSLDIDENAVFIAAASATPIPADSSDITVRFTPALPPPDSLNYYAPSRGVLYDTADGAARPIPAIPLYIAEGPSDEPPRDIGGFSIGLAHDPTYLRALDVEPGPALAGFQGGAGAEIFTPALFDDGIVLAVVIDFEAQEFLAADSPQEIARVTYSANAPTLAGDDDGAIRPFAFESGLGGSLITNVITIDGQSNFPNLVPGAIHFVPQTP